MRGRRTAGGRPPDPQAALPLAEMPQEAALAPPAPRAHHPLPSPPRLAARFPSPRPRLPAPFLSPGGQSRHLRGVVSVGRHGVLLARLRVHEEIVLAVVPPGAADRRRAVLPRLALAHGAARPLLVGRLRQAPPRSKETEGLVLPRARDRRGARGPSCSTAAFAFPFAQGPRLVCGRTGGCA